jgi:pSer/pThr/pTyr-binding forkhead associated (FHA) protein
MTKISSYTIGRSADSDIQLDDSTVSRTHAEMVITAEGKYYLTDCGSSGGTYLLDGNDKKLIKQTFVDQVDNLCFGEYHTSVQQLISMIDEILASGNSAQGKKGKRIESTPQDALPDGPVRRDVSGGIISDEN